MAILKKLDLFRSINTEYKEGSVLGSLITLVCVIVVLIFFSKEMREYKSQKLSTKLYVQNLNKYHIALSFDIVIYKMQCEELVVSLEMNFGELEVDKTTYEENGCRLIGNAELKHMDNKLFIRPDIGSTLMDFMIVQNQIDGTVKAGIDMSHKINKFQFGRSVSKVSGLADKYPEMVQANPLDGIHFVSADGKSGHSMFMYEMNIVTAKIGSSFEIIYNYNKNTINSFQTQPLLNFIMDFSPIAIEYIEGSENFLEFLTYILGILGGILAIVKFVANLVQGCWRKSADSESAKVMEM
jgi:hypothetical protein